MAEVELTGVHKAYGATAVVRGVDLRIADGEILALLGPSGCGKTTTLRMIAGLERPSQGVVRIGGETVYDAQTWVPPERRRLGMVFQSYAVWPHLTVAQNVAFPLEIAGERDVAARVAAALGRVHLDGLGERLPHQLSGGQQQRVALARALVAAPRVLLLDEPLSNLDARLREEVRDEIRGLVRSLGVTVVLVTHDQGEALGFADRVAVMSEGRIRQCDPPEALYARPVDEAVARAVGPLAALPGVRDGDAVVVDGVRIPASPLAGAPAAGPCRLGVRPAWASLANDGLTAEVVARTFAGDHVEVTVRVAGAELRVHGDGRPGDVVRLRIAHGWALPEK